MTISNVTIRYSGGVYNNDPSLSIGGSMSSVGIASGYFENLFNSDPDRIANQEYIDYRAIYILNSSNSLSLRHVSVYLDNVVLEGSSSIKIGVKKTNQKQRLTISNYSLISSGYLILSFKAETTNQITWNGSVNDFKDLLNYELNSLSTMQNVTVNDPVISGSNVYYEIEFIGFNANKNNPTIKVEENELTPTTSAYVNISQEGHPINAVAQFTAFSNTPPYGITFLDTSADSPLSIGDLSYGENFYIWIQRTIPSSTVVNETIAPDSFSLVISGTRDLL